MFKKCMKIYGNYLEKSDTACAKARPWLTEIYHINFPFDSQETDRNRSLSVKELVSMRKYSMFIAILITSFQLELNSSHWHHWQVLITTGMMFPSHCLKIKQTWLPHVREAPSLNVFKPKRNFRYRALLSIHSILNTHMTHYNRTTTVWHDSSFTH